MQLSLCHKSSMRRHRKGAEKRVRTQCKPASHAKEKCVFPENIHTPPPPLKIIGNSEWEGGFKSSYFRGVGGVHGKLLFQRVTNHEQNTESNVQSIVSTYVHCFETKISTPGH